MNKELIKEFAHRAFTLSNFEANGRFPPSRYYNFLRVAVQGTNAKTAVELGVCGGGGSYHMCKASNRCIVVGVDHVIEYPDNIKFIKEECKNFNMLVGDSIEMAHDIQQLYPPIDILFIDTDHTYDQTKIEFETYLPLMAGHGQALICLDDLNREGVRRYWENDIDLPKIEIPELHVGGSKTDGSFGVVWGL